MAHAQQHISPAIRYDAARRRLWILGQRCHHGALGALITTTVGAWVATRRVSAPSRLRLAEVRAASRVVLMAGLGGALMLHDLQDHSIWFERGPGSQP
jgi:hypothetical protein